MHLSNAQWYTDLLNKFGSHYIIKNYEAINNDVLGKCLRLDNYSFFCQGMIAVYKITCMVIFELKQYIYRYAISNVQHGDCS